MCLSNVLVLRPGRSRPLPYINLSQNFRYDLDPIVSLMSEFFVKVEARPLMKSSR